MYWRKQAAWVIQPPASSPHIRPSVPGPHKIFIKLSLLLVKFQWRWSCAHYFQWFTGNLNDVDILMSHKHVLDTTPLFNMHLNCFVGFILYPTNRYMFKFNYNKIWLICSMCSKLKVNTAWYRSGVSIVDLDHSHNINKVFLILTLKKHLSAV